MLSVAGFDPQLLDPHLLADGIDGAFARFATESLASEYPDIHVFPTSGKDGAIDFVVEIATGRVVGDYKYLGSDGLDPANRAWRAVSERLRRNLAGDRPVVGQSQYAPWFDTSRPIREYWFVVSSKVKNLNQRDTLTNEIQAFFGALSASPHLSHLSGIRVRIIDWSDFDTQLASHPHLLLRWFPRSRPLGLVPFGAEKIAGSFRAYLSSDRLSFYSRSHHRRTHAIRADVVVPDEATLVSRIDFRHVTGLVVTGMGGYGKSRLVVEVARVAQKQGWVVLHTAGRVSAERIAELGRLLSPAHQTLIVIDYVETQSGFDEFVESVNALNDTYGLRVGWIASCRSSFYSSISALTRHVRVDLAPSAGADNAAWERGFRVAAAKHILEQAQLADDINAVRICRDLPALAVFLLYLRERNRTPELEALLREQDFGRWVARRIQASFGSASVTRELASIAAMLPMSEKAAAHLTATERDILDRLAADGWVEQDRLGDEPEWVAAHDVLADQVLLSYLDGIRATVPSFIGQLFEAAERSGATRSALVALQRIRGESTMGGVPWSRLLEESIGRAPASWTPMRPTLLKTSLLQRDERLLILRGHEDFWNGAEHDVDFQNALGWMCRDVVRGLVDDLPRELLSTLTSWTVRCAWEVSTSNFVVTWGLRLAPAAVKDAALAWITERPNLFQTHYLIVSWLESDLGSSPIRASLESWLRSNAGSLHVSFVVRAWLEAGGELDVVRPSVGAWLERYQLDQAAEFVYKAWLDAKGELDLVRLPIVKWLERHEAEESARFVYPSWLDANGEMDVVRLSIVKWLERYGVDQSARFVYTSWLDAGGELDVVRAPIIAWLERHHVDQAAQFVYKSWLDAKGELEVVRAPIIAWLQRFRLDQAARFVYASWLDGKGELDVVRASVLAWLAAHQDSPGLDHVYRAWLEGGGPWEDVSVWVLAWLRTHHDDWEATHLLKYVTKQDDLPTESVREILYWCRVWANDKDALWRLSTLLDHNEPTADLTSDYISAAEAVLSSQLQSDHLDDIQRGQISFVVSSLASLEPPTVALLSALNRLIISWLRHPESYGRSVAPRRVEQSPELVARVVALIGVGRLSPHRDSEALARFAEWLALWDDWPGTSARSALAQARAGYAV